MGSDQGMQGPYDAECAAKLVEVYRGKGRMPEWQAAKPYGRVLPRREETQP